MAIPVKVNHNALAPPYSVQLLDGWGNPLDLTGATSVTFELAEPDGDLKASAPATIVDATNGIVKHLWAVGDTDTLGLYFARWIVVTIADGPLSYPSEVGDLVEVVAGPTHNFIQGPCSLWTTVANVRDCCSVAASTGISDDTILTYIDHASDLLYTLSGRQFAGSCQETVRPCAKNVCGNPGFFSGWGAGISQIPYVSDPSAYPPPECGCGRMRKVDLGFWPILAVNEVKINGVVIDPDTYRVDENRYLVSLAGPAPDYEQDGWPRCQYLDRPDTEDGTWSVNVTYGIEPPPAGVAAATTLACELLKACYGGECNLPGRVTSVNRQGISMTMIDPSAIKNGQIGLYDVDLFIQTYNPKNTRSRTLVWSPDLDIGSWRAGT
jgi:hypothetical protein